MILQSQSDKFNNKRCMYPLREIMINKSPKGLEMNGTNGMNGMNGMQATETQATVALCELSDEQAVRNALLEGLSPWSQQEKIFNKVKQQLKHQFNQQFKRQFKQELKQQSKQRFEAPSKQIIVPMQAAVAQRNKIKREGRREKTQTGVNRKRNISNKENEVGREVKKEQVYPQASQASQACQAYRRIGYPQTDECTQIITCLKRKMPLLKAGAMRQQKLQSAMVCNIGANAGQLWLQSAESIKSIQSIQSTYLTQSTLEEQISKFPSKDVTNGQFWKMKPKRKNFRLKSQSGTRKQFLNTPIRINFRKKRLSTETSSICHPPNYHSLNPLTRILYQKYAEALRKEHPRTKAKGSIFENLRAHIGGATQFIQKRSFSEGRERESFGRIEGLGQTEGLGRVDGRKDGGMEMRPCWN